MKTTTSFYFAGRLAEAGNTLIVKALKDAGVTGLAPSHGDILVKLFANREGLTMTEIARAIHRTRPTVTVLVAKLTAAGFAEQRKDGTDGRRTLIRLSAKGESLKGLFDEISLKLYERVSQRLDEREIRQLENLLKKVVA